MWRALVFTYVFLCSWQLVAKEKERLEALLVFDTSTDLCGCLVKNRRLMLDSLLHLAKAAEMDIQVKVLEAHEVTSSNIQTWFASLKKKSHDVVFFYFSGHGRANRSSEWPILFLNPDQKMVSMDSLIQDMKEVTSRLSLFFSDCCNSRALLPLSDIVALMPVWSYTAFPYLQKSRALLKRMDQRGLKKFLRGSRSLLLKTKGCVVATAASKNQMAIAFRDVGTVFTVALSSSLVNRSAEKHPSWEQVLLSVDTICRPLQIPHVHISVR